MYVEDLMEREICHLCGEPLGNSMILFSIFEEPARWVHPTCLDKRTNPAWRITPPVPVDTPPEVR